MSGLHPALFLLTTVWTIFILCLMSMMIFGMSTCFSLEAWLRTMSMAMNVPVLPTLTLNRRIHQSIIDGERFVCKFCHHLLILGFLISTLRIETSVLIQYIRPLHQADSHLGTIAKYLLFWSPPPLDLLKSFRRSWDGSARLVFNSKGM